MKKLFYTLIFAALCLVSCNDDSGLFNLMLDTDQRIARLEELCSELNTNITSLQVIVEAQQSGDYITNITPITKDGQQIGYTITFAKHPAITIYNGENGKDGVNGTNGQNGQTPVLGAAKDADGIYYWTLNGTWLLDGDGHKIRVTGEKGDKGATGATGQNGTNGTNGTDGVTPQLKIENDYWYISYNNGATWTQLGKAKGDKGDTGATGAAGTNGTNGQDGQDGDSMFQSVTYDGASMTFVLIDGTSIVIPCGTSQSSDGYSVSGMTQGHYYVDLDLPSGTKWATCNVGSNKPEGCGYYYMWGDTTRYINGAVYPHNYRSLPDTISATIYDAAYIKWGNQWQIPTKAQCEELTQYCSWTLTTYNDVAGWKVCGPNGNAIFLPITGFVELRTNLGADFVANKFTYYRTSLREHDSSGKRVYCLSNIPERSSNGSYINTQKPTVKSSQFLYTSTGGACYFDFYYTYACPIRPVLIYK